MKTSPPEEGPPPFTAVILCGGRSSRMGCDKAFIEKDSHTLLAHQLRLVQQCGAEETLISGRLDGDYSAYAAPVIYDAPPACGPLGGLISGLAHARTPLVLLLAVDMPDVPAEVIIRLHRRCASTRGAVYHNGTCFEPLCAFYPIRLIESARANHARKNYSLQPLIRFGIQEGTLLECALPAGLMPCFRSWNHPEAVDHAAVSGGGNFRIRFSL